MVLSLRLPQRITQCGNAFLPQQQGNDAFGLRHSNPFSASVQLPSAECGISALDFQSTEAMSQFHQHITAALGSSNAFMPPIYNNQCSNTGVGSVSIYFITSIMPTKLLTLLTKRNRQIPGT